MEYVLVVGWLLAYAALAVAGLPLAARLFPRLPGRGVGFALPLSLVVVTTVVYWIGHVSFGPLAVGVGVALLLAASLAAGLDLSALRARRVELAAGLRSSVVRGDAEESRGDGGVAPAGRVGVRSALAEVAAVFALAFLFVVAIRAMDPAVHAGGGEKFLDFGLLKSLARAEALPPEDVWFAGEPVRYYYGGHLVASVLSTLTGTAPTYAYNLALAGFYAMLVAAAYDLAGAVAAHRGASRRLAGALAAFFVGFAGNLVTAGQLLYLALPDGPQASIVDHVAARTSEYTTTAIRAELADFDYWLASRVIPDTINEFPLFSWLNGDLHAHMMGMPFLLLGAALAYSYYLTPEEEIRRRWAIVFVAVPVLAGLQVVIDTWSFPSIFGLLFLSLAFADADPLALLPGGVGDRLSARAGDSWLGGEALRVAGALAVAASAGGLALVLGLPFLLGAGASREVALLAPDARSAFGPLVLVHGAFLLAFGAFLADRLRGDGGSPWAVLAALLALVAVAAAHRMAVLALVGPFLVFGWLALRLDRDVGYETVLLVAGAGLVLLVEFVYVEEQAGPLRMNTVFKTYMQIWVLWGTAAGAALAELLRPSATVRSVGRTPTAARSAGRAARGLRRPAVAAFVALLVLSTVPYGALALSDHLEQHGDAEPTLSATAFVETDHPDEAAAIRWLDEREGQPTMLSAPGTSSYPGADHGSYPYPPGMYTWDANPAASLTGVPTVAGWGHEVGYRGEEAYYDRVADADAAYTGSTGDRVAVLRAYDVRYVWVGPAERDRYPEITIGETPGVDVAFERGAVTVYEVDAERLPEGENGTEEGENEGSGNSSA
ncbi:DUF2298 domain-containing protein [Halegenticoccus tardaugens]|uniref:DUF2298 domain-containing protein n=1 Tax=Halegenticoccus tardaugens TaxID=2071624 RepID=UPI00100C1978|nr:DUF2298 domain-containing protein [Halegenticoccus tardaugens]